MQGRIDSTSVFYSVLSALFLTLLLAACNTQNQGEQAMRESKLEDPRGQEPLRNLNPSPQKAYDIRIVLKDSPGPFSEIDAAAQYDVVNAGECGEPQPISGAVPRISTNEVVKLERISNTEFAGRVYVDQVLDEDYYGRGVCRWKFVEVRVSFRASDDPYATWFVVKLPAEAVEAGSNEKLFYWNGYYPNAEIDNYAEFGNASLDKVPEAQRSEFFEIELSAAGATP